MKRNVRTMVTPLVEKVIRRVDKMDGAAIIMVANKRGKKIGFVGVGGPQAVQTMLEKLFKNRPDVRNLAMIALLKSE